MSVIHVKYGCRALLSPGRNPQQNWDGERRQKDSMGWWGKFWGTEANLDRHIENHVIFLWVVDTEGDGRKAIQTRARNRRLRSPTLFVPPCRKHIITGWGREKVNDFSLFIQKELTYLTLRTRAEEFLQISIILRKNTLLLIAQDNVQSSSSVITLKETYTDLYIW